jgi:hypothetical protein
MYDYRFFNIAAHLNKFDWVLIVALLFVPIGFPYLQWSASVASAKAKKE